MREIRDNFILMELYLYKVVHVNFVIFPNCQNYPCVRYNKTTTTNTQNSTFIL